MYERRDDFVLGGNNGYQQNGYQTNNLGFRPEKRASDGVAIASFVIGIISIVGFCCLGGFLGIVGAILGIIALKDNQCNKRTQATVGLWLSVVAFILTLGIVVYGIATGEIEGTNNDNKLSVETQTNAVSSEVNTQNSSTENTTEASKPAENTGDSLVYDSKDIKVYFVGVEETYLGTELKFRAENNRSEDIEITVDTLIINEYDVTAYFYLDVASGLKKVESITILQSSLDDIGVSKIDKVTCNFKITEGLIDTVDTFSVTLN